MRKKKILMILAAVLLVPAVLLAAAWMFRDALTADIQKFFADAEASLGITEEPEAPELEDFLNGQDPEAFIWEDYQALTPDQQMQFPDYFESLDAFNRWYESVDKSAGQENPDLSGMGDFLNGQDPADFTREAYQALSPEQQAQFPDFFESLDAFNNWYDSVTPNPEQDLPEMEDFLSGRDPEAFTWADYQELTAEQQAMFPDYFESYDAFQAWKDTNQP